MGVRPVWATWSVPGQPRPNSETLSINQRRVTSVEGYLKKAGLGVT